MVIWVHLFAIHGNEFTAFVSVIKQAIKGHGPLVLIVAHRQKGIAYIPHD